MELYNKFLGCLAGIAIGDALGMPTEFMTPQDIRKTYGIVRTLCTPHSEHIHNDLSKGSVTDDTEQNLFLLNAVLEHGEVTVEIVTNALIEWANEKDVFNSSYLGPSSRRALQKLMSGADPYTAGSFGTTIGAAMRVPAAALFYPGDIAGAIQAAAAVSLPTHGTSLAISGAAAIAAGLAECLRSTASVADVVKAAKHGAEVGLNYGYPYPAASLVRRIDWALELVQGLSDPFEGAGLLYEYLGVDMVPHEIVPDVIALFSLKQFPPMERLIAAANMGGDTDTIAALLGSLLGAFYGIEAFAGEIWREVDGLNNLRLEEYARRLCAFHKRSRRNTG